MAHHVVHAVIGAVQLVMGRGDGVLGHGRQRCHGARGVQHVQSVHCVVHLRKEERNGMFLLCFILFDFIEFSPLARFLYGTNQIQELILITSSSAYLIHSHPPSHSLTR